MGPVFRVSLSRQGTPPPRIVRFGIAVGLGLALCGGLVPGPALGQVTSDDFDRHNLDTTRWTFVNPLDDGQVAMTGAGTGDAKLELSVPEGPSHDPYHLNRAVRVMQPCADNDFDLESKFDTEPTIRYQLQGLIVEADADNWLRFDISHDGANLRAYVGKTISGSTQTVVNTDIATGSAGYLRVLRAGDVWTFYISGDGVAWTEVTSFSHALAVTSAGPFVANHTGTGGVSPAYTAVVDYLFDRAAPIVPEDDGPPADTIEPLIHTVADAAAVDQLTVTWFTDEPCLGTVEYGPDTGYGSSVSDGGGIYAHAVTIPGLVSGQTVHYRIISDDGKGNVATSGDFEVIFSPEGPTIDVWYGAVQPFGVLGNPQPWANVLGHVSDPDGVAALSYTLNGGPDVTLSIGPDGRRLENPGDFNVDLATGDLAFGNNTVVITAEDVSGNLSVETVTVYFETGNTWPDTYATDWGSLTSDGDPVRPDSTILEQGQVVDGEWSLNGGEVRTLDPGYDRLIAIGDTLWDDYEATVSLTLHSMPGSFGAGLLFRWNGHTDTPVVCGQPKCGYEPLGDIGWLRSGRLELYKGGSTAFTLSTETLYWVKMRVENNASGVLYSVKAWEDGQAEPGGWMVTNQQGPSTPQTGSLMLISHEADVSFGDVSIVPVTGTPNTPPVANDDTKFVVTGTTVEIDVLANDTDSDGVLDPATVALGAISPAHGTIDAIDLLTGEITYTHDGGVSTSDSFTYTVDDNDGATSNEATVTLTIGAEPGLAFASDDFNRCALDPRWTFVDTPVGGGGGSASVVGGYTDDARAAIYVPGGASHQLWDGVIEAPFLYQTAQNADFTLEVKFDSPLPGVAYHEQGIVVLKGDQSQWLRFELYSTASATMILAARPDNSLPVNHSIGAVGISPLFLRITRSGTSWSQFYSTDGTSWIEATGSPFVYDMTVEGVGCYAGNAGSNPEHTALVDYFLNPDDPIAGEDVDRNTLAVAVNGGGSVTRNPDEASYDCDEPVQLTAVPDAGWQFDSWSGDVAGSANPETVVMDAPKTVTATFVPSVAPDTIFIDAGGVAPLSTTHPCAVEIPCAISRTDVTDVRRYSVTFALDNLELCDGVNSILEGDYLSGISATQLTLTDHLDGSYTVDCTILDVPCGATAATGTLFTMDVTHSIPDGIGTITITSATLEGCDNAGLPVAAGAPASILIDTTSPAPVEDLVAQQVMTGNPGSTTAIDLSWTASASPDAASVEVYAKGFGYWPEYDDDGGAAPALPTDPAAEGWTHHASLLAAEESFRVEGGAVRDFWYFSLVIVDTAGNPSSAVMSNGRLNYLLADVSDGTGGPGDNAVGAPDLSLLGSSYGASHGDGSYDNVLDIGPTGDSSLFDLPETDNVIEFEDLILFAMGFGMDVGPAGPSAAETPVSPAPADLNAVTLHLPASPTSGQTFVVGVVMSGDGRVQGLSLPLVWNRDIVEPIAVEAGALLAAQGGAAMVLAPDPGTVDVALMGLRERGISGEGVLAEVSFRVLAGGDPGIRLGKATARDRNNRPIDLVDGGAPAEPGTAAPPRFTALHRNAPNPFGPATTIAFDLARPGPVKISIYRIDGRLVKTLVDDSFSPGRYSPIWYGTNNAGRRVASGVYLVRMETSDKTQTRRMVMLK